MIGVTLASPETAHLATEAVARFTAFTGKTAVTVTTPSGGNYAAKFELASMFRGQTVVFFDADLWFNRPCDLSPLDDQEEFLAVRDPGIYATQHFPAFDSAYLGIDVKKYFNSGFFVWNDRHRHVFAEGEKLFAEHFDNLKDFGEQSCLNAAAQKFSKVRLISNKWNYLPVAARDKEQSGDLSDAMELQTEPWAVHAAGYPPHAKEAALKYYSAHFNPEFQDAKY